MARKSVFNLTKKEFHFLENEMYPKTKQRVIQKLCKHFADIGDSLKENVKIENKILKSGIQNSSFKITKGENYKGLPYVVLDYPQIKSKEFTVLFRTMFWWGKYISLNLILKTSLFNTEKLAGEILKTEFRKLKMYSGEDIWENDLSDKGFILVKKLTEKQIQKIISEQKFIKVSLKIPFKRLDKLDSIALEFYKKCIANL